MGREIRRVPLDFDWKLNEIWKGFVNPYTGYSHTCDDCGGTGLNPATRELYETWYDNEGCNVRWWYKYGQDGRAYEVVELYPGACRRWLDKLTQDEVDALAEEMRFPHITHDWVEGEGWKPKNPMPKVSAEEINRINSVKGGGHGHDSINCWICVKVRAKRLGVYGVCEHCHGEGSIVTDPELEKKADEWEREAPPEGEGWQVWETVSEGSPITPVFATPEKLVNYLVNVGAWGRRYSREAAEAFVNSGWVPSAICFPGVGFKENIEAAPYLKGAKSGSNEGRGDHETQDGAE